MCADEYPETAGARTVTRSRLAVSASGRPMHDSPTCTGPAFTLIPYPSTLRPLASVGMAAAAAVVSAEPVTSRQFSNREAHRWA